MTVDTLEQHIEIDPGVSSGKARITGHCITVENIVTWHDRMGQTCKEIADKYGITIADVYAALGYYYDNRSKIDQSMKEGKTFIEHLKQGTHIL